MKATLVLGLTLFLLTFGLVAQPSAGSDSACISCHGNADLLGEESAQLVLDYSKDIHSRVGLSCEDCHGGNADSSLAEDMETSMSEAHRPNPFRGVPDRGDIPGFCGRCHSDPSYMKRFRPDIRVDQESEYWTSQHGQSLRKGNNKVATCIDCHGVHGILEAGDSQSPVYPTHVAETCRGCHSDAERMAGSQTRFGDPLPLDQYARWRQSVHAKSMLDKGDLSAPTCNDCHGNHGAAPPGLESVGFVCGQCHGREADLFRESGKHSLWQNHNEYLSEVGNESCAGCHEAPSPQASVRMHSFSECTSCHSNHGIVRPTVAHFSPLPETPCSFCHEGPAPELGEASESEESVRLYQDTRDALMNEAGGLGLSGDDRFDWMVDRALRLPYHTRVAEGDEAPALRPEFARLFEKFRIGKTYYEYTDPTNGETKRASIVRCTNCHDPEGATSEDSGLFTGIYFLDSMRELTALTGRAERTLLQARRGGIETRDALLEIDRAVDAQIGLEVLVHTFHSEGGFGEKHAEGMEYAHSALQQGEMALEELDNRRFGLRVSLVFIGLVLVGLALKIRQIGH